MPRSNENAVRGMPFTTTFTTFSSGNAPIAPDIIPEISVIHRNGAAATISGTDISQLQNLTPAFILGYYLLSVPTSTLNINDQIDVRITATILGAVRFETFSFTVVEASSSMPYIG